jgi:hypothetical protein
MKKVCLIVLLLALLALPLFAKVTLINLGYNVVRYDPNWTERGIGPVFTFCTGIESGFYAQVAPWFATSEKFFGVVYKYSDYEGLFGGGLNFTLGYGRDFDLGEMGVLVGGGFSAASFFWVDQEYGDFFADAGLGPGAGAHFYYKLNDGRTILDFGLNVIWRPLSGSGGTGMGYNGIEFNEKYFNININAGIGFRRGAGGSTPSSLR